MRFLTGMIMLALAVSPGAAAADDGTASGDLLYVTNGALDQENPYPNVARFTLDAAGAVSPAGTEPAGRTAQGIVFTPQPDSAGRRFAYVASIDAGTDGVIDRYQVGANGSLTRLAGTDAAEPFGIAISPDGRMLYVANFDIGDGQGAVSAYRIGTGGTLTLLNTTPSGALHAKGIVLSPDGRYLYASHGAPVDTERGSLIGFPIGPDGSVGNPFTRGTVGATGHRVVITPDGRFVFVTSQERGDAKDVYGFRVGSGGNLTPVPEISFEAGTWVEGAAVTPDGKRLYVTALGELGDSTQDGQVRGFSIGADGNLTAISVTYHGFDPIDLAFGPDGRHAYIADFAAHTLAVFTVESGGGLHRVQTVGSQGRNPGFQSVLVRPRTG